MHEFLGRRSFLSSAALACTFCPLTSPAVAAEEPHAPPGAASPHWAYEGEARAANWGELSPAFKVCQLGLEQSPVDLATAVTAELGGLDIAYQPMKLRIVNNGHTIQVNAAPGSSCIIGGTSYELQQFHFHHPSEHVLSGKPFDLECHLVHRSSGGDFAVIGIFIKAGENNAALEPIWRAMPRQAGPEQDAGLMIDASPLLPNDRRLFRYMGSLTTPPCTQGIVWTLLRQPIEASSEQIRQFRRCIRLTRAPCRVAIAASCSSQADKSSSGDTLMNTFSAAGSLIADRAISTKVGVGFACVLALLAIVSTTSYLSFQTSAAGFNTFAQRVSVVGIAREIERGFLNLRRYVREFALSGGESNVEAANKEQAALQPLFQQGLDEIKNPERHRLLDAAARNFEVYWKDFGQLATATSPCSATRARSN